MSPAPRGRRSATTAAVAEGAVTAIAGGALGAFTGSVVGLAGPAGAVGALNGLVSGWRGTYRWRSVGGWVAAVLDSTWGLPMTAAGLVAHGVAAVQRESGGYVEALSRRRNRHVYGRGLRFRRGFVVTLGNTVNAAGPDVATSGRRSTLVTDHEDVHIWQGRWFGPLYPVLYLGWSAIGALVGIVAWLRRRGDQRFGSIVEVCAYYLNPFEWWAYSREGRWPPTALVGALGWRRPAVRPFATTARRAGRGRLVPS